MLEIVAKTTSERHLSGEGDEDDFAEKLEETQRLLEDARDRATDAEMECDSLRKQLEEQKAKTTSERHLSGEGDEDDLAEKLEETQKLLEDARDRATAQRWSVTHFASNLRNRSQRPLLKEMFLAREMRMTLLKN